jgi:FtsP/CotA-like multicopper oxidase with cupredoxin domain
MVTRNEVVRKNTLEVWEIANDFGNLMIAHPIHLHGPLFQVLDRRVTRRAQHAAWLNVRQGYVDEGWKDTVLVMPGERVRILVKFGKETGLSLYHCHNLDHEDTGMMRHYRVID